MTRLSFFSLLSLGLAAVGCQPDQRHDDMNGTAAPDRRMDSRMSPIDARTAPGSDHRAGGATAAGTGDTSPDDNAIDHDNGTDNDMAPSEASSGS